MVRESLCAPDIELLSVSLRPFYLPREFTQLFVTLVYIHPKANMDNAVPAITRTVLQLQAISPAILALLWVILITVNQGNTWGTLTSM